MIQQVSDAELQLMKIIWSKGGRALYAEIMEELAATGRMWQKNTIITLLSRLIEKGLLKSNKIGRRNLYIAIVSEEDYRTDQAKSFVNKLYEGNVTGLVATLVQSEMLTAKDYEELKKYWEGRGEAG
ncbi:MAG: BlaI/MecI/CopY family transcriptional regulator [Agathobacter sp.]|nr:BlaI/MecI/CopY family transcriptional regulator [Agathobacter sp.]